MKFLILIFIVIQLSASAETLSVSERNRYEHLIKASNANNNELLAKEAVVLANSKESIPEIIESKKNLAALYQSGNKLENAIEIWFELFQIGEQEDDSDLILESYKYLGKLYLEKNNISESGSYFLLGLKFALEDNSTKYLSDFYYYLGELNRNLKDFSKAVDYYKSALSEVKDSTQKEIIYKAYLGLGRSLYRIGDIKEAKSYIDSALLQKNLIYDKRELALIHNYSGLINYNLGKGNDAYLDYTKALDLLSDLPISQDNAYINYNLASLLVLEDRLTKAEFFAKESFKIADSLDDYTQLINSSEKLNEIYLSKLQFDSANKYLSLAYNLQKNITDLKKDSIVKSILEKYETEKKEEENNRLANQIELEKTKSLNITLIWLFSSLVFLGISFILYYRFRVKSKANKRLIEQNEMIEQQSSLLKILNSELTNRNDEIQIINSNLLKSEAELKEANATKDKFFSIIAHDLKNPISGLLISSEMILKYKERLEKSSIIETVGKINQTARRVQELLEDLLQWARVQSGRIEFKPEYFEINDLIKNLQLLFQSNLKAKKQVLTHNLSTNSKVFADKYMVDTVLRNLISNAIKFTPEHGKIEVISTNNESFIDISIKDNGVGIPSSKIDDIFKTGSSHSTLGTNKEKGTGIGLVLCKEFIKYNSGMIKLNSKVNSGSVFTISLPKEEN